MSKLRIGVLGPADIAKRRMVPAIQKCETIEYVGVAVALESERGGPSPVSQTSMDKARAFTEIFGGAIFEGYMNMLSSDAIDAVYIALPPALHYRWAKQALLCGKHVLLEKPFTTSLKETKELIGIAKEKKLAVHENFAFCYHAQMDKIREVLDAGTLGDIRTIRGDFSFPFRGADDFRYKKALGGGALLDCGCYTIKVASLLLGPAMKIESHILKGKEGFDVDIYGAITATGSDGAIAQLSFGMDRQYNCELEIWGSKGVITSPRLYTPPADLPIELSITTGADKQVIKVDPNDQFAGSARAFAKMTEDDALKEANYEAIIRQSSYVDECMER